MAVPAPPSSARCISPPVTWNFVLPGGYRKRQIFRPGPILVALVAGRSHGTHTTIPHSSHTTAQKPRVCTRVCKHKHKKHRRNPKQNAATTTTKRGSSSDSKGGSEGGGGSREAQPPDVFFRRGRDRRRRAAAAAAGAAADGARAAPSCLLSASSHHMSCLQRWARSSISVPLCLLILRLCSTSAPATMAVTAMALSGSAVWCAGSRALGDDGAR